ncbi:MAG: cyclic nucleotide-gated ion channel [Paracoccaceae bacterium]
MFARALTDRLDVAGKYLAFAGLIGVALLTQPDLAPAARTATWAGLAAIWAVFTLSLGRSLAQVRTIPTARYPALAADAFAVLVPLAGLALGLRGPDAGLCFGVWLLKPLAEIPGVILVARVIRGEARNLLGVLSLFLVILFGAALAAYLFERAAQPEQFGSIPRAMWWAVVTLTTTGYGDKIPTTFPGRLLAGMVMISGIAVFALWAGILATGFAQEIRRRDFSQVWQLVARASVFASVDRADLAGIVEALRPRKYAAGAVICKKGQVGTEMYFITDGRVRIEAPVPVDLGPGQYFGEMALVTGEPRSATVTAASAVTVLTLHVADFQHLFGRESELARTIRATAEARARANAERDEGAGAASPPVSPPP